MKVLFVILIFIVGGWYYLVNYYYAIDKNDKSIERYMTNKNDEKEKDLDSDNYDSQDVDDYSEKQTRAYSKKQDTVVEINIHHSVYDESSSAYKCDGRTRCTQMRSCAEAKYFLANCKGVIMDGDGDGIPCESQWCNSGIY
jgi:hypothetical protein